MPRPQPYTRCWLDWDATALQSATPDLPSCQDLLQALVQASEHLGQVAHAVLGHVAADNSEPYTVPGPETLQTHLRFLRTHIVSTVDQQGAAVWSQLSPEGRPLFSYAIELQETDSTLLAELRCAADAARALPGPGSRHSP